MKTMKKLQVAAAAASLFAVVGVVNAATITASGSVLAVETIQPTGAVGAATKVRAGSFAYNYEGSVTAAGSRQYFQIAATLGGTAGDWAVTPRAPADVLVPDFSLNPATNALTIQGTATPQLGTRARVAVISQDPPQGQFAIVLREIRVGQWIQGAPNFDRSAANTKSVTYFFELVNNTGNGVDLGQLSLQFHTQKTALAVGSPSLIVNSAADAGTDATATYGSIYGLQPLVNAANGDLSCTPEPGGAVTITLASGINIDPVVSAEESLNNTGASRTAFNNYLLARRATDIVVSSAGDRLIQTTNSFQTNEGATPVNGIGGTGGGRFTFKPSTTTVVPNYGSGTNGVWTVGPVGNGNATYDGIGTQPVRTTSGDERAAKLGVVSFSNRGSAQAKLDRLLDVDPYAFVAEVAPGAVGPAASTSPLASGAGRNGDFTAVVGVGAPANVFGGVDTSSVANAFQLTFTSKPSFAGFARGAAANQITLNRGNITCPDTVAPGALGGTLVESPAGSGNYIWSFSAAALQGASGTNSLFGDWTVCYNVDGVTNIPATFFRNAVATLLKDDATEQSVVSCPSRLAEVFGGVKIDVRNFQMLGALGLDKNWMGILRVINNSETDTATVDAQYIHNTGAYGKYGTIATLAPRAATYVFDTEILAKLTNNTTATGVLVNNGVPTANTIRLRVSADVSTLRVQNYVYNVTTGALTEVSSSQGADFVNVDSSNRDHIDQDAQTDIKK